MHTQDIIELLDSRIVYGEKPAVYISGGLDSTILLYHLLQKTKEALHTYTFGWSYYNEFKHAKKVAEYYNTIHHEIILDGWLNHFSHFLQFIDRPRFNLQPFFLCAQVSKDGRKTGYCGEGLDESFGGYWYKSLSYHQSFADHYVYSLPMWKQAHDHFSLTLHMPFSDLPIDKTLPLWDEKGDKQHLREIYADLLPSFVLERKKNPAAPKWPDFWKHELYQFIPGNPITSEEVRELFNHWVIKKWVEVHSL